MLKLAEILTKMWIYLFLGITGLHLATPTETAKQQDTPSVINLVTTLSQGNLKFAIDLYKLMSNEKNVLISPFSVRTSLAMVMAGAKGRTLREIRNALHLGKFSKQADAHRAFSLVINSMSTTNNYSISITNRAFIDRDFEIKDRFKSTLAFMYEGSVRSSKFKHYPRDAATDINYWVSQQSDHLVHVPFDHGEVETDSVILLLNTIYFNGIWKHRFNPARTKLNDFYLLNGKKARVPMLIGKSKLYFSNYAPLGCKLLQLEYLGERYVMYIMLPLRRFGINSFKKQLTSTVFETMRRSLIQSEVVIKLPKIIMNYYGDVSKFLAGMNMSTAFEPRTANLSGMSNADDVFLSEIRHRAFIRIDENGTVAAAVTAVSVEATTADVTDITTDSFIADHPFAFAIFDTFTNHIIFIGNVDNPSK